MMRTIQFTGSLETLSQISSLTVNGKIIKEREVESSGHVLEEVVCRMRYREGNLRGAFVGFISQSIIVEP